MSSRKPCLPLPVLAAALLLAALSLCAGCALPQGVQGDQAVGRAHYNRAMAFGHANQLDKAARELELAVQSDPGLYYGYYQLGLVYEAQGRRSEAISTWQRGINAAKNTDDRGEYPRAQAIAEMQSAQARLTAPLPPPPAPAPIPVETPLYSAPKPAPRVKTSAISAGGGKSSAKSSGQRSGYAVLFSSNQGKKSAQADQARLKAKGYSATLSTHKDKNGKTWHRVVVGCCGDEKKARALAAELKKKGLVKSPEVIHL